ncbi:hypothetical protein CALCODRAFT_477071 [Calocera cornea HHB12733]|uniref:Anamorsin C-terminal domain-containing protein n=1 Tax=Calocera cornea HHB12733 TaxID=1353952 RepID=A0A165CW64_9BASI|nr:hypothetical protein CALCODRAFT_477071 [Calocera cornea HHB12733]
MCLPASSAASTSAAASAAPLPRRPASSKASKKLLWALSAASSSETIDSSTLLTSADLERPAASCAPGEGPVRKRRACKNCSCGLAEEEAADAEPEEPALSSGDSGSDSSDELPLPTSHSHAHPHPHPHPPRAAPAGKQTERQRLQALADSIERGELVTSCGNCAMGDAFRCPSCPYLGMPAFTPGEKVIIDFGDDL